MNHLLNRPMSRPLNLHRMSRPKILLMILLMILLTILLTSRLMNHPMNHLMIRPKIRLTTLQTDHPTNRLMNHLMNRPKILLTIRPMRRLKIRRSLEYSPNNRSLLQTAQRWPH